MKHYSVTLKLAIKTHIYKAGFVAKSLVELVSHAARNHLDCEDVADVTFKVAFA